MQVRAAQHSSSQDRRAKQEQDFARCLCKTWCFCETLKTFLFLSVSVLFSRKMRFYTKHGVCVNEGLNLNRSSV